MPQVDKPVDSTASTDISKEDTKDPAFLNAFNVKTTTPVEPSKLATTQYRTVDHQFLGGRPRGLVRSWRPALQRDASPTSTMSTTSTTHARPSDSMSPTVDSTVPHRDVLCACGDLALHGCFPAADKNVYDLWLPLPVVERRSHYTNAAGAPTYARRGCRSLCE